jgi:hypothetical protein
LPWSRISGSAVEEAEAFERQVERRAADPLQRLADVAFIAARHFADEP